MMENQKGCHMFPKLMTTRSGTTPRAFCLQVILDDFSYSLLAPQDEVCLNVGADPATAAKLLQRMTHTAVGDGVQQSSGLPPPPPPLNNGETSPPEQPGTSPNKGDSGNPGGTVPKPKTKAKAKKEKPAVP